MTGDKLPVSAQAAYEMQSVSTPLELIEAAKYNNPRLVMLVRDAPAIAFSALQLADQVLQRSTNLVATANHMLVRERLQNAMYHAAHAPERADDVVWVESGEIVDELTSRAQALLDMVPEQRTYWFAGAPKLLQLEQRIKDEIIAPMQRDGVFVDATVRVGVGAVRGRAGSHHDLAVGRVRVILP